MSNRAKYCILSAFDILFTFGAPLSVLVLAYCVPTSTIGYKLTLTGIMLFVLMLFIFKAIFEKGFRAKYDMLLQQIAETSDVYVKEELTRQLNAHKVKQMVYQRAMIILPFVVIYAISYLGQIELSHLQAMVGIIILGLLLGSIFNICKRKYYERANLDKLKKRAEKRRTIKG